MVEPTNRSDAAPEDRVTSMRTASRARQAKEDTRYMEEASKQRQMNALRSVMQTTDRIMSGQSKLGVRIVPDQARIGAPAWTDGETIFLNKGMVEQLLDDKRVSMRDFIRVFKGTNYHELAHVLFSPRYADKLPKMIRTEMQRSPGPDTQRLWMAYLILEDQRIETLYTTLYAPTRHYFIASATEWLLQERGRWGEVYPLLYGRKYLSPKIRARARRMFVDRHGEAHAAKFEQVIDKYLVLRLPPDTAKAFLLVKEFRDLMTGQTPEGNCHQDDDGGIPSRADKDNTTKKGKMSARDLVDALDRLEEQIEEDREAMKEAIKEALKDAAKQGAKGESDDDGGSGDDEGDGDEDDAAPGDGDGDGDGIDVSIDIGSDGQGDGGTDGEGDDGEGSHTDSPSGSGESGGKPGRSSAGSGGHAPPEPGDTTDLNQDLQDILNEALEEAMQDEEFQQDVTDTIKSMRIAMNRALESGDEYRNFTLQDADSELVNQSQRIVRILRDLHAQVEPSWLRGMASGRMNPRRIMLQEADPTMRDVFDRWDEGNEDEASVEVVIALDLSGSMSQILPECSKALWMLKRAFDKCDIRTTVYGFSEGHTVLYKPTSKVQAGSIKSYSVWAGTEPHDTIKATHALLSRSTAHNRVFIAITDGAWQGNVNDCNNRIASMRRSGITTALFTFGADTLQQGGDHNCEVVHALNDVKDMVRFTRDLVETAMKKAVMAKR